MIARAAPAPLAVLTDQCVRCGLCLPHCPSYRVLRVEGQSPRGRIALAQALTRQDKALMPSARLLDQLDGCLSCGNCERVCPSSVAFGEIIASLRAARPQARRDPPLRRALRVAARRPRLLRLGYRLMRLVARSKLRRKLPATWQRLLSLAEHATLRAPAPAPARGAPAGKARALGFATCVSGALDGDAWSAAEQVLARIGIVLDRLPPGTCCGALERHAGRSRRAAILAARAARRIARLGARHVVHLSSGCHAGVLAAAGAAGAAAGEALALVADSPALAALPRRPLHRRVALHLPCTQRAVDDGAVTRRLLRGIPGLTLLELPAQPTCCGAAGIYFVDHAAVADALADECVAAITALAPEQLLTSNIGCRLWLEARLAAAGRAIPVRHPVELLAESLRS